ncbi:uncharacterized [Tachysurus ichikawai]
MALLQTGLMIQTPGGSVPVQLAALSRVAQTLEQSPEQSSTSHLHPPFHCTSPILRASTELEEQAMFMLKMIRLKGKLKFPSTTHNPSFVKSAVIFHTGKEAASPSLFLVLGSGGGGDEKVLEEVLQEQCDECYRR